MVKQLFETAASAVKPLAKRVVTPLLDSPLGEGVGTVRVLRRFAKQWASSADLYEVPVATTASTVGPSVAQWTHTPGAEQRPVRVFTSRKHSSCKTAKRILDELEITFEEVDLSDDPAERERLYQETRDRTFPQVYIDGVRLGGFDDLVVAREEGRLQTLLYPEAP